MNIEHLTVKNDYKNKKTKKQLIAILLQKQGFRFIIKQS